MNSKYLLRNLLPDNTNINFMKAKFLAFALSLILMIATFVGLYSKSLNFGIDFTGGILFEVRLSESPDLPKIRNSLNSLNMGDVTIQSLDQHNDILIKSAVKDESQKQAQMTLIRQTILNSIDSNAEFRKTEFVGAEVGNEMIYNGSIAIALTFLGIIVYVWIRFNWQYSIGIVLGLFHDVILTLGFLVITEYEFNLASIAAILTILGYSVNDTVVIYDRVREKVGMVKRLDTTKILNLSINETLSRTLLTVITTLLAAFVLIYFGGDALKSFSITIFVGIIIGTYSSVFTSIPILSFFDLKKR